MFADLFTIENLTTFLILTALETVLGFDNLLYISIEAKRVGATSEAYVRRVGTLIAIGLRIVLLFVVLQLINLFQNPFLNIDIPFIKGAVSGHAVIVLLGGVFLIYTAMKEIYHMLSVHDLGHGEGGRATRTVASAHGLDFADEHRLLLRHGPLRRGADEKLHRHDRRDHRLRRADGGDGRHGGEFSQEEPHV